MPNNVRPGCARLNRTLFKELCARRVQSLLKEPGIATRTQAYHKLADEVGCSPKTLENWIAGTRSPFERNCRRAAEVFGVTLEDLLEPVPAGLRDCLWSFDDFIEERTRDFVGREFVFEGIRVFQSRPGARGGYFVIEGQPGSGKSSILAEYARQTDCIAHFNNRLQGVVRADVFLRNVCAQLALRYHLDCPAIPDDLVQDSRLLSRMLNQASQKVIADEKVVIAVDALDEVDLGSQRSTANILYLPETLPPNVQFVLTARRLRQSQLVTLADRETLDLRERPADNRRDVCRYIHKLAAREGLARWIAARNLRVEEFVELLAEKSEDNFMYLRYVLPAVERGEYSDLSIANLPSGLDAYYDDHWRRMGMRTEPLPRAKLKVIYFLAYLDEPVTRSLLSDYTGESELVVQTTLDEWADFLTIAPLGGEKYYSLYHGSFKDYLERKEVLQAAGLSLDEVRNRIIDELLGEEAQGPKADDRGGQGDT